MVERLEGFCSENDWKRAYNEMNEFEKELKDWGAVIIKFWGAVADFGRLMTNCGSIIATSGVRA